MLPIALDVSGLDPNFKGHAQRGIGRYVSELKRYFDVHHDPEISVSYFNHRELLTSGLAGSLVNALPLGRTTVRQQCLYPFRLSGGKLRDISLVHFPAHMDAPAWSPKPFVLTVLDLIPLVLKDLYRANRSGARFHFARWLEITAIRSATALIAISEHTAKDIVSVLGVPRERIIVTPLGVDRKFFDVAVARERARKGDSSVRQRGREVRNALGLPAERPLMLYVGGHDERKNIRNLIAITREVVAAYRGKPIEEQPFLVLAGRIGSPSEQARLDSALSEFAVASDCKALGYVADHDLLQLYTESSVFLFPSLYEGFGLPPLEAMAAGLPVVSSGTSAMPEVIGDAGLCFDPTSVDHGARAVLDVLSNSALALSLVDQGIARARLFTWERTGQLTLDAYRVSAGFLSTKVAEGASGHLSSVKVSNSSTSSRTFLGEIGSRG